MKLIDILLEQKLVTPEIAYHATKSAYLRSILKHGLVPNKSENGYASNQQSSEGYSLKALPGVYFSTNGRSTKEVAKDFQIDGEQNPLIIVAKVQPHSAEADEDIVVSDIIQHNSLRRQISKMKGLENVEDFAHEWVEKTMKEKLSHLDQRQQANIEPIMFDYIVKLMKFMKREVNENELRDSLRKLTIAMKNVVKTDKQETFKINQTIGFSGANRIIGIYSPLSRIGWGELGDFERDAYHKVKNPLELLKYNPSA